MPQSTLQFGFIDIPVSQRRGIVVASAKPAVVHHQHFQTQLFCFVREGEELIGVKVKQGSFPGIDQQRTLFRLPSAPNQIPVIEPVESSAHFPKALIRIDHHRLRSVEGFTGLQLPGKIRGIDAQDKPGGGIEITFRHGSKVAGIHQIEAVANAVIFIRAPRYNGSKGICGMAGGTPLTLHPLHTSCQRSAAEIPFPHMASIEGDEIVIHGRKVHTQAHRPFQAAGIRTMVCDRHIPGHDSQIMEYRVVKRNQNAGCSILHVDFQGIGLTVIVNIGRGKTGNGLLSCVNPVGFVADIGGAVTIGISDRQSADPEITGAVAAVFHGGCVGSKGAVRIVGAEGCGSPTLIPVGNRQIRNGTAVINLQKAAGFMHPKQIGRADRIQLEGSAGSVKMNGHGISSLNRNRNFSIP